MTKRFEFILGRRLDPDLLNRVEDLFHGENLIQLILHAHLLMERAITLHLVEKLARPDILEDGKYGRWSFHQKLSLYVGLVNPAKDHEDLLFAFNRLRNMIAHRLQDPEKCVQECLPWEGSSPEPDPHTHAWVAAMLLLFELGAIKSTRRIDLDSLQPDEPQSPD